MDRFWAGERPPRIAARAWMEKWRTPPAAATVSTKARSDSYESSVSTPRRHLTVMGRE